MNDFTNNKINQKIEENIKKEKNDNEKLKRYGFIYDQGPNGPNIKLYWRPKSENPFKKLFGASKIDAPLKLEFISNSLNLFDNRYEISLDNVIFLNTFNNLWKGSIRYINTNKQHQILSFEVPNFKLNFEHDKYPLEFYLKYKNYSVQREQNIENYDVRNIIKSFLPHDIYSTGIKYKYFYKFDGKEKDLNTNKLNNKYYHELNNTVNTKLKANYQRINKLEDSFKIGINSRVVKDLNLSIFNLLYSNEFKIKGCHIFNRTIRTPSSMINQNPLLNDADILEYPNHFKSLTNIHSNTLHGLSVVGKLKEIGVGKEFYISQCSKFKLHNISYLNNIGIISSLNPYIKFETFFIPEIDPKIYKSKGLIKSVDLKSSFKLLFSFGFDFKVNDLVVINFSLYTNGYNINNMEKKTLGQFRIGFDFV
jgi:hypothetical protein